MAGDDNEPHTGTPDQGLHDEAESTEESQEGSYTEADHGAEDVDEAGEADGDDGEHDGHYVDSNHGLGDHESHPEHGEYVQRDHDQDREQDRGPPD